MGAHNHVTVVPKEKNSRDLISYDDDAHGRYMWELRSMLIRSGTINPRIGRIIEQ